MLVTERSVGDVIRIGDDIRLTVLHVAPGHVRLGVEAPRDVSIARVDAAHPTPAPTPRPEGR